MQLVGGSRLNGTVLRATDGQSLSQAVSFRFSTADGVSSAQLFRNSTVGGPRRVGLDFSPANDGSGIVLNKLGQQPLEIRLHFDQALNPSTTNVPTALDTDPLVRSVGSRGRIFLEYDDPVFGTDTWIPADVELERNTLSGSTVVLRPVGVLPNNATIRVVVESSLEDISGESNLGNAAYERYFGTFTTRRAYEQQFDAVVDEFLDARNLDLNAAFAEPIAEVGPGYVRASLNFEGGPTNLDFEPQQQQVVLNTNFTQVTPKVGAPFNVTGGVFNFRNVQINSGITVRGQGTNPMVWLVSGRFEVAGTLSVRGGDGVRVTTTAAADVAKTGGAGVCGGGNGGAGSPQTRQRSSAGATGNGPLQQALRGGGGGVLSCFSTCMRGSGGGGGSLATQGDPNFLSKTVPAGAANPVNVFPIFGQQAGTGGLGCSGVGGAGTRQLPGGIPGPIVFSDARQDNNFWGSGVNFRTGLRIQGELAAPLGGGGGGGGGDLSYNSSSNNCNLDDSNFRSDAAGGGGGGGGGVLIVKALGDIVIRETGRIIADGGSGGCGEVGSGAVGVRGGGGGGGAGGMVVLMSATRIEIHAHGGNSTVSPFSRVDTYAQRDYDFAISADGGVCVTASTTNPQVLAKYPAGRGQATVLPATYDSAPLGGFGGMGIVQLMAPPGNNSDGTNTVLDDNIRVMRLGVEAPPLLKRQLLAWRGYPNAAGDLVGDDGLPTSIGDNEGDIRPAPILLPAPFGAKSRIRTKWIDTGASVRRGLLADDGLARGVVEQAGAVRGPLYEFAATATSGFAAGYLTYDPSAGESVRVTYPAVGAPAAIVARDPNATFLGQPAYRVQIGVGTLGDVVDRYAGYHAELRDGGGAPVRSFRILSHSDRVLVLSPDAGPLPTAAEAVDVQLRAKFVGVTTNGIEGLGPSYSGSVGGARVPNANLRLGFAFHRNPANSSAPRLPSTEGTYLYDLSDPVVQESIRQLGAAFVQVDILFDCAFRSVSGDVPTSLSPTTPRPKLEFLTIPFRF
ncbi:MAG: Ig-like domain-containing protein [Planctomycetes bacterium]|nr:Ig-like domain-containing protein [Planctomycetota bacterium]